MSNSTNTIVSTSFGKLEGVFENGLYVFKGIPFATPPIGDLRWLPPQPYQPWKGTRKADTYGAIAPQNGMREGSIEMPGFHELEPQSEDCLFLNVYTPGLDNTKRPVMVWIHGGGFSIGSGSQSMYSASTLVKRGNIVLVTLNYRLGVLGFLNFKELTGGQIPATGNEGLLDQIAGLEWVRANIAAFGGDPGNVTIFGESAGAMSVACLMTMPKARGLFQKAIMESPVGEIARPLVKSIETCKEFLKIVGIEPSNVKVLRSLKVERLLSAQLELGIRTGEGIAPAIPVADGGILPKMPLEAFETGLAARVPTIIGTNLDEQRLFSLMNPNFLKTDEQALQKYAENIVGAKNAPILIDTYRRARKARGEPISPPDLVAAMTSTLMYRETALRMVIAQHKYGQPAYNYLFTWKSPAMRGILGACHALEIGFVFGNYDSVFCGSGPEADKLSLQIQDAWAAFARTGNPGTESLGEWPVYGNQRQTMILSGSSHVEKAPYEEERHIWETFPDVHLPRIT